MSQVFKIGRNKDNSLVLDDKLVEEFHAHLFINDTDALVILDLKSKYGSLVNGARVDETILKAGDELQIGFSKIDWLKIEIELRSSVKRKVGVKKATEKVFTEVETNYSGEASYKLAVDELQREIAVPKIKKKTTRQEEIKIESKAEIKSIKEIEFDAKSIENNQMQAATLEETAIEETRTVEDTTEKTEIVISVSEKTTVEETKIEETTIEETKIEETKIEETKIEETKIEEIKTPIKKEQTLEKNINAVPTTGEIKMQKITEPNVAARPTQKNKKSFDALVNNPESLYLLLIITFLTMFFLGWIISNLT